MNLATSQRHLNVESAVTLPADHKKRVGCSIGYLILGFICTALSILSIHCSFLDLALNERIKLRPGLPAFEKWKNPSVDLGVRTYIFAVENPHEFLHNRHAKLKLREIGPIYYKKIMRQEDVVFHEADSTMSFTTVQEEEFVDEMNEPFILNKTITIINPILLGLGALTRSNIWAKYPYEWAAKKDSVFINRTVYDVLWNTTSPILEFMKQIPFVVRRPNAGILFNSFFPSPTRYNVNIGPKHGFENFFKINTLNGLSQIDVYAENFPKHCPYSLKGASEGTGLPPKLTKDTVIRAYTKNLCRTYPMVYNRTVKVGFLDTYEYVFAPEIYTRSADPDTDCQRKTIEVVLPDGLTDSSKCALGMPMALSNPHFCGYRGKWETYIDGLNPQPEQHSSHMWVEPISGIQLDAVARIQSNMPMPSLEGYPEDVKRFSEMILPQFWMEYTLHNEDPLTHGMIFFVIKLPVVQTVVVILLCILSAFAIYKAAVLGLGFHLSRTWKPKKCQTSTYPTTRERYFSSCSDGTEKTAL